MITVEYAIYFKDEIYLVPESRMKEKILKEMHNSPLVRHLGYLKTYKQIRERFSWKGLKNNVLQYVQECATCQQNKSELTLSTSLLQPFFIPEKKWDSISMDFISGLPNVQGKECIFLVVDGLKLVLSNVVGYGLIGCLPSFCY